MSRIFFINRFFFPDHSATSQLLTDLAFYVQQQAIDVHILTSRMRYDDPEAVLDSEAMVNDVNIHRLWSTRFGRGNLIGRALDYLSFYVSIMIALLIKIKKGDVVVVKTDPPMLSVVAYPLVRLHRAKLINWLQDIFPETATQLKVVGFNDCSEKWLCKLRNLTLKYADHNVVIGRVMGQHLNQNCLTVKNVTVIHNWSDAEQISPIADADNPLIKQWALEHKFVVGYSGNLGRAHDFQTMLDCAERLKSETEIVFLFIGGGAGLDKVQQQVNEKSLNNVLFKPYQSRERLIQSLNVIDLHWITLKPVLEGLIVPSKFYGIIAAGKPLIFVGHQNGEIAQLIQQCECGSVVNPGDVDGLTERILKYKNDPDMMLTMGQAARHHFIEKYNKKIALKKWLDLLVKITRNN